MVKLSEMNEYTSKYICYTKVGVRLGIVKRDINYVKVKLYSFQLTIFNRDLGTSFIANINLFYYE